MANNYFIKEKPIYKPSEFVGEKIEVDPRFLQRGDTASVTTATGDYGSWDNFQRSILFDTWMGEAYMSAKAWQQASDEIGGPDEIESYNPITDPDNADYLDYVIDSKSPKESYYTRQMVDYNTSGKRELEEGGAGVSRFMAQIVDPVNLVPLPATWGMKFVAAAKRAAIPSAAAVGASEGYRYYLDPTMTPEELALNVTTGTILSSALVGGLSQLGRLGKDTRFNDTVQIVETVNGQKQARNAQTNMPLAEQFGLGINKGIDGAPAPKITIEQSIDLPDGTPLRTTVDKDGNIEIVYNKNELETEWKSGSWKKTTEDGVEGVKLEFHSLQDFMRWKMAQERAAKNIGPKLPEETDAAYLNKINKEAQILFIENAAGKMAVPSTLYKDLNAAEKRLVDIQKRRAATESKAIDKRNKAQELRDKAAKTKSASWRTRWNKEAEKLEADAARIESKLTKYDEFSIGARNDVDQAQQNIFEHEQAVELGDYNFKATGTGLEKIAVGELPFHRLINNKIGKLSPKLAIQVQKLAYMIAGSPGLVNEGARRGIAVPKSVEMLAKQWHEQYKKAMKATNDAYMKYAFGREDVGAFRGQFENLRQKAGFSYKGKRFGTKIPEGKIDIEEFRNSVSRALIGEDEVTDPALKEAVEAWKKFFDAFDKGAKDTNLYPTLKAAKFKLDNLETQLKEAINKAHLTEKDKQAYYELRDAIFANAKKTQEGKLTPEAYRDLFDAADWDNYQLPFVSSINWGKQQLAIKVANDIEKLKAELKALQEGEAPKADSDALSLMKQVEALEKKINSQERMLGYMDKEIDTLNSIIDRRRAEGESTMGIEGLRTQYMNQLDHYNALLDGPKNGKQYFHRMFRADKIRANREEFVRLLKNAMMEHPYKYERGRRIPLDKRPSAVEARAEELADRLLREGSYNDSVGSVAKGEVDGTGRRRVGGPNARLTRKLVFDEKDFAEFLEMDIDIVAQHYAMRMAPTIEMQRMFGDFKLDNVIDDLHAQFNDLRAEYPDQTTAIDAERKAVIQAVEDLRDKVLGTYGIPENPDSLTNRTLRTLKGWNTLGYMGKAWMAATADSGRVAMSEGFYRTFGGLFRKYLDQLEKGRNSEWALAADEVEKVGEAIDVFTSLRMSSIVDNGPVMSATGAIERWVQKAQGPFFVANGLSVWTDNAKRLAGALIQDRIIGDSILWTQNKLPPERIERLASVGINEKMAQRIVRQWEEAGSNKGDHIYLANTDAWSDFEVVRTFRAAMAQDINTAVITPHAADKFNFMSKPLGSVLMQYRGFGVSATQRIMLSALQQRDKQALIGVTSMIALAGMMDYIRRPDYVELDVAEQIFRAVEKSGVTGVFSDINSAIEIASGNQYGLRSVFGFQPVIKDPTWAERTGAPLGAVGTQWLNFVYALTDGAANGDEQAAAIRYMLPFQNLWFWSDLWTRAQRSAAEVIEE